MPLTLTVNSYQRLSPDQETCRTLDRGAITIGRSSQSDWVLPDPERFLSRRHCKIEYRDEGYILTVNGPNGVIVNTAEQPLEQGHTILLNDGDQLTIGDYQIGVAITPSTPKVTEPIGCSPEASAPPMPAESLEDAFADLDHPQSLAPTAKELEPEALEPADRAAQPQPEGSAPEYLPDPLIEPPADKAQIPDDWWRTEGIAQFAREKPPRTANKPLPPTQRLENEPPAKCAEPAPAVSQRRPSTDHAGTTDAALLLAFLEGAGIADVKIPEDRAPEVMAEIGKIFRETVQGLMRILITRANIKGEFGLDRTTVGPIANNPLKTPPGRPPLPVEEVMAILLTYEGKGLLAPARAVREGFEDVRIHQLAVLAGIKASLTQLLRRFNPDKLERRLQQSILDSLLPLHRKARYWEQFRSCYEEIASESDEDIDQLFGKEFARAYERMVQTIRRP